MKTRRETKDYLPFFLMGCLFVIIHSLALLIATPSVAAGMVAFENPNDPMNIIYLFISMLLTTLAILLIAKFWKKQFIKGFVLGATGLTSFYFFYPLIAIVAPDAWALSLSIAAAAILLFMVVRYPEWYVIDICAIILGSGSAAMLGISLSTLLTIVLLLGLALYDAISVYKTKHMIDLADTIFDLKLPIALVIPKNWDYSLIKETKSLKEKIEDQEERHAFFLGLGDIIMPGILVVSAFYNAPSNGLLVAGPVMAGTLLGLVALTIAALKEKPQAGLPYLCSGAIISYLVASYAFR